MKSTPDRPPTTTTHDEPASVTYIAHVMTNERIIQYIPHKY